MTRKKGVRHLLLKIEISVTGKSLCVRRGILIFVKDIRARKIPGCRKLKLNNSKVQRKGTTGWARTFAVKDGETLKSATRKRESCVGKEPN